MIWVQLANDSVIGVTLGLQHLSQAALMHTQAVRGCCAFDRMRSFFSVRALLAGSRIPTRFHDEMLLHVIR